MDKMGYFRVAASLFQNEANCEVLDVKLIFHSRANFVFSHSVMAALFVSQSNERAAMFVSQTSPVGVELFSYVDTFFCTKKFA